MSLDMLHTEAMDRIERLSTKLTATDWSSCNWNRQSSDNSPVTAIVSTNSHLQYEEGGELVKVSNDVCWHRGGK